MGAFKLSISLFTVQLLKLLHSLSSLSRRYESLVLSLKAYLTASCLHAVPLFFGLVLFPNSFDLNREG